MIVFSPQDFVSGKKGHRISAIMTSTCPLAAAARRRKTALGLVVNWFSMSLP
jgi:hypothetical protein